MRPHIPIFCFTFFCAAVLRAEDKAPPVSIAKLVEQTLAENPEVRFYEGEILAARAERQKAAKWANPELNLEAGRKSVRGNDASASGLAWAASLAQPIEWPGRLALRKAVANGDVALAERAPEGKRKKLHAKGLNRV